MSRYVERPLSRESMNEDQLACFDLLSDWLGGDHHCPKRVNAAGPRGITCCIHDRSRLATYDLGQLTALVVLAHDRCIRAELGGVAPGLVRLYLHRRSNRDGHSQWDRHPALENHVERLRPRATREG